CPQALLAPPAALRAPRYRPAGRRLRRRCDRLSCGLLQGRQHLVDESLELCFLVPARQAQRHLREAKPLVGEEVLNTFLGRAERAPAPDSGWTELLAVVGLKEALRFPKGLMSILIDVDVVVEVCLEAVRVAACVQ